MICLALSPGLPRSFHAPANQGAAAAALELDFHLLLRGLDRVEGDLKNALSGVCSEPAGRVRRRGSYVNRSARTVAQLQKDVAGALGLGYE